MSFLNEWIVRSEHFFDGLGIFGILAYALLMVICGMVIAPLSPLTVASGIFFGFGWGFAGVMMGTITGAAVNFLASRYLFRGFITRRLANNPQFQAIDAAVAREGWRFVVLMRFVPLPFGFVNYTFGLTAVRFWPYLISTAITIMPSNIFLIWLGASTQEGIAAFTGARQRHPMEYIFLAVGLIAAFVVLTYITKIARTAMAKTGVVVE